MDNDEIQERVKYLVAEWNRFVDETRKQTGVSLSRVSKLGAERRVNAEQRVKSDRWWGDYKVALRLIPYQPETLASHINFGKFVEPDTVDRIIEAPTRS